MPSCGQITGSDTSVAGSGLVEFNDSARVVDVPGARVAAGGDGCERGVLEGATVQT
jgi:hypothetical protein